MVEQAAKLSLGEALVDFRHVSIHRPRITQIYIGFRIFIHRPLLKWQPASCDGDRRRHLKIGNAINTTENGLPDQYTNHRIRDVSESKLSISGQSSRGTAPKSIMGMITYSFRR